MRAKYVLNEALIGLWRNVTMTIAMIITMSICLFGLGATALGYLQIEKMRNYYYGEIRVAIFLNNDVTEAERTSVEAALAANPMVDEKIYESKEQALARFKEIWSDSPDLTSVVESGHLPESFRVKLKNPEQYDQFAQSMQGVAGIQEIIDQGRLLDQVFKIFGGLQFSALGLAALMAVAALLLIGNTIQVAAYSKRREVAVMRLVGASNWFIQAPFVLEAVVAGVVGALLGWLLLLGAVWGVVKGGPLEALQSIITPIPMSNVVLMLPLMAGVASAISAVWAWVMLRFYLRV